MGLDFVFSASRLGVSEVGTNTKSEKGAYFLHALPAFPPEWGAFALKVSDTFAIMSKAWFRIGEYNS